MVGWLHHREEWLAAIAVFDAFEHRTTDGRLLLKTCAVAWVRPWRFPALAAAKPVLAAATVQMVSLIPISFLPCALDTCAALAIKGKSRQAEAGKGFSVLENLAPAAVREF